tara:strand:- start:1384 stop:2511 length:1128 start_codon:yes stop_codon:yes gene_type:complete
MKFIDLQKQYKKIETKINSDVLDCFSKGDFILGEQVYELEHKLSEYVGVKECITCASGTDALLIPLMANDIGQNDAVFTTNFSFFATAEVISLVGATPIFVDIDQRTFNINPELLELEIKKIIKDSKLNPKAIIAVDLFGQLANYAKLEKIAKKYDLILIEDAAQSFGASYNGKKSCSFGDISSTSFYPAKPLGCYGDGGAIFTDNLNLAEKCRSIRVHGQGKNKYNNIRIGLNSRLDTIQAIILLNKIKIFDHELELRKKIASYFSEKLSDYIDVPLINKGNFSSWAQYSILSKSSSDRHKIINHLKTNNIPVAIFYKEIFSDSNLFKNINSTTYPISKDVSKRILSIPIHPYISQNEQDLIISSIIDYYKNTY